MALSNPTRFWQEVALGEDTNMELKAVEFRGKKVTAPRRDSLADEMAAFGNGNGGRLVLGVTDDGRPQSLDRSELDTLVRLVGEICMDSIKPSLDYSVFRVAVEPDGGGALLVEIPQSTTVHHSPGGYFRRKGDRKHKMEAAEVSRLTHMRGQSDDSSTDTQVIRNTGIKSLHRGLWRKYMSSRIQESSEVALAKLKFIKRDASGDFLATVGGVLLASEDPRKWLPNAWVQAVCYRGQRMDSSQQIDSRDIAGPIDQQIREAVRFVEKNMRTAAYKDPARMDLPQFSIRAVFEAVVNAVVHRDYAVRGSHIRLLMFKDRLELYSPGGLCNSMTTEDLRMSQFTRNELLASRLGQCPVGDLPGSGGREYFIERRGEGVGIIEDDTYSLTGQKPMFQLIGGRELKIVLPAARLPVPEGIPVSVMASHGDTEKPQPGVQVLVLYPNNTYLEAQTDALGQVRFSLHSRLPVTVFCAAEGFEAHVERHYLPESPLKIFLRPAPNGGSQIIPSHSGNMPGIQGHLNPILDALDRIHLYASGIVINEGQAQPVHFLLNESIHLRDALGASATLWFREMLGASCIFDYRYEKQ